jgi:hypothetical protein
MAKTRIDIYAKRQDRALDETYHYGRSTSGFGYEANKSSAKEILKLLEEGIDDLERLANASHEGWAKIAKSYEDPVYKTKPQKRDARLKLANTDYRDLPEEEKEKDRVAARALLNLWRKEKNIVPRTKLENTLAVASVFGLIWGLAFMTVTPSGYAISSSSEKLVSFLGAGLLIIGLVAGFFFVKAKKK